MNLANLVRFFSIMLIAGVLASCGLVEGDGKHNQPLDPSVVNKLRAMGSSPGEAMVMRLFKEESVIEVWKRTSGGAYKFFKSYEICAWSGELGPKIKEGDRQAPEGFYSISPGLMNPNSNYYLAFNTGFPNKFDRAWGRTGSDLMVHGDCSSRGCYAMTDEQIAELYALGREAFKGGQRTFELQLYPFRMTAANLAKHRKSPHIDFWRNLKVGYDAFEISKQDLKWDVCEKRYVFYPNSDRPLDALGACPAGSSAPELMAKVAARQDNDNDAFQVAAAELDAKAEKAAADAAAAEKARQEQAVRDAEMAAAVNERTSAITNAVGGFFSGLFGGGQQPAADSGSANGQVVPNAPFPAARSRS